MTPAQEIDRLLAESGAELVRHNKHLVYRLAKGKTWTRASTPSDHKAELNMLRDLRRAADISDPERGKPGERREHRPKPGRPAEKCRFEGPENTVLADQLRATGIAEEALKDRIEELEWTVSWLRDDHRQEMEWAKEERWKLLKSLIEARKPQCWWCRLKAWWKS